MEKLSTLLGLGYDNPYITTGFAHNGPVMQSFDVFINVSP